MFNSKTGTKKMGRREKSWEVYAGKDCWNLIILPDYISAEKVENFMIKSYATTATYTQTNIFTPICPRARNHVSAFLIPITFLLSSSSHSHWTSSSWSVEFLWTAWAAEEKNVATSALQSALFLFCIRQRRRRSRTRDTFNFRVAWLRV